MVFLAGDAENNHLGGERSARLGLQSIADDVEQEFAQGLLYVVRLPFPVIQSALLRKHPNEINDAIHLKSSPIPSIQLRVDHQDELLISGLSSWFHGQQICFIACLSSTNDLLTKGT